MSESISLYEAKTHLSHLVERAAGGEEIVITKHGVPYARLLPMALRGELGNRDKGPSRQTRVCRLADGGDRQQWVSSAADPAHRSGISRPTQTSGRGYAAPTTKRVLP